MSAGPPSIAGLSHLGISVADLDAACAFWVDVMGFEVTTRLESLCFVVERNARLGIGLTNHDGTVGGPFDERQAGLDHLALAVRDVAALHDWADRLDALSVAHSPVIETDAGHHLNLRAPDNFPIELFVMAATTAAAFGLTSPEDAVAHTHR